MAFKQRLDKMTEKLKFTEYGRNIPIIAIELFRSTIKEKRFYLALLYFVLFPIFLILLGTVAPTIQSGNGFALYEAHSAFRSMILAFYTSFFLGQIFIVLLNSDAISGEVEADTLSLLRSKPVYDSEIIIGKFLGMLGVVIILDLPTLAITYFSTLVRYDADWPVIYLQTMDEFIFGLIIILLLQSIILSMTVLFSTIFSKNLYSILSSFLALWLLSQVSGVFGNKNNYLSFNWLLDATLPQVMYHLEPVQTNLPNLFTILFGMVGVVSGLLAIATYLLRNKELL